jgi:alpha-galactosidase
MGLSALLLVAACTPGRELANGDLTVSLDEGMKVQLSTSLTNLPLVAEPATFSALSMEGEAPVFSLVRTEKKAVTDAFGKGTALVFHGEAPAAGGKILQKLTFTAYDRFPSTVIARAEFTNATGAPISVNGWTMDRFEMAAGTSDPGFWSFQGQSTENRADWIFPVREGFFQKNYMGMNGSDYGGGTPVTCLWRRDAGLAVGHLEPVPQRLSLPVEMKAGESKATVSIVKEFDTPVVLEDGGSLATCTTFFHVFKGDCFGALRNYAQLLECVGVVMPESEPDAFEPAWCAWGYERLFTIDEIIGTLPKVKELGFKWATLDDGYQIAEGDWDLNTDRFPRGDADMKYMVDEIHKYGLKADLWWAPFAADPGTKFLEEHPNTLILDQEGKPRDITWWDSWYLSPVDEEVRAETKRLVEKFIGEYGYEGLKLDGQYMNAVPPDYNPAHHPDDPEKVVRELPTIFKLIYDTARGINPHAVLQYCPCGDCFSVYNLPYTNKTVSSDPLSSWQIRTKGYVLRALAPKTAYYGDHIELSDGGNDYPTQLGIGAILGTKFTWPKENPRLKKGEPGYLLTPEREALLKNALDIFYQKDLAHGEYVSGLYDIGFDYPETHVIRKDGTLNYAFYTHGKPVQEVELRGLEAGHRYQLTDYYNHKDLGVVTAEEKTVLPVPVDGALLVEAVEIP